MLRTDGQRERPFARSFPLRTAIDRKRDERAADTRQRKCVDFSLDRRTRMRNE
jgi:hypothetical protein